MGSDKALLTIGGESLTNDGIIASAGRARGSGSPDENATFLAAAKHTLSAVAREILLSANDARHYSSLRLPSVADAVDGAGPIGGLIAGFEAFKEYDFVAVLACDLPLLTEATFRRIVNFAAGDSQAEAVLPIGPRGPEPLCAVYRPRVARLLRNATAGSVYRIVNNPLDETKAGAAALDGARVRFVAISELTADPSEFTNVNDREQLAAARRILQQRNVAFGGGLLEKESLPKDSLQNALS